MTRGRYSGAILVRDSAPSKGYQRIHTEVVKGKVGFHMAADIKALLINPHIGRSA